MDIEKGNLLRLGKEGVILAASHGTRKMNDIEIERAYGRARKRHVACDYATHLQVTIRQADNSSHQKILRLTEYFDGKKRQ